MDSIAEFGLNLFKNILKAFLTVLFKERKEIVVQEREFLCPFTFLIMSNIPSM